MNTSITHLMLEHHRRVNKLLQSLMDGFGMDKKDIEKTWLQFVDELEQHMRVEEQVIFSFTDLGDSESQKIIRDLLAEHGQIRGMLKDITTYFRVNFSSKANDLQKLLHKHESKENRVLYPKLDAEIDERGRKFLLSKIDAF